MSAFPEYHKYDGLGLAELVRTSEVSPVELLDEAIARIEAGNPRLNAVVRPMYEQARATADAAGVGGPFAGVPFLIKEVRVERIPAQ